MSSASVIGTSALFVQTVRPRRNESDFEAAQPFTFPIAPQRRRHVPSGAITLLWRQDQLAGWVVHMRDQIALMQRLIGHPEA